MIYLYTSLIFLALWAFCIALFVGTLTEIRSLAETIIWFGMTGAIAAIITTLIYAKWL